jgi:hypothetical protein
MNMSIAMIAAVCILFGPAQSSPGKATLLIVSRRDQRLRIVDPVTLRVLADAPVGSDPYEVIASADGTRAYVSNYSFGAFNTLTVIDLVHRKPLGTIDLGALRGPHGLATDLLGPFGSNLGCIGWLRYGPVHSNSAIIT